MKDWGSRLRLLALVAVVPAIAMISYSSMNTQAATVTMLPSSDITTGWTASSGTTHYSLVSDGTTDNTTDYVQALASDTTASVTDQYGLSDPTWVSSASQVALRIYMQATTNANGGTMDTISLNLIVNGVAQAATTCTPVYNSWTTCSGTYTGSWTQSDVNSMQVSIVRNILGSGKASTLPDTVQVANVYGTLTYTPSFALYQSAYRWFNNQATPVGGGFDPASNYAVGTSPASVTTADVDNDGKPDIVTANYNNANVSVLLNTGSGFAAATNYTVGTRPFSVTTADIDNDGKPDIITANYGSNNVSVLLNTGIGFSAATNYTVGTGPQGVTTADINADGKPDIISSNLSSNNVSVLLNTGTGFSAATNYAVGTNPRSVTSADVNNDGKPDVITANLNGANVSVLLNTGTGFSAATNYTVGSGPEFVTTADVNADTKPDIVTANFTSNNVSVLLNTGTGFSAATNYPVGTGPFSVFVTDLNADTKPDIIAANYSSSDVSVLLNTGTSFSAATNYTAGSGPHSIAVADVDADTKPDIIAANYSSNNVSVLINTGTASQDPRVMSVGTPLAAQDTTTTAPADGEIYRLRLDLHVAGSVVSASQLSLKLQYAALGGAASCSAVSTGSFADVTDSSIIRYATNSAATNGMGIAVDVNDPVDGTDTNVAESYQQSGTTTFTNQNSITVGQDGLWDFALTNNRTFENTTFCFRVVNSDNSLLNSYNQYPEITTPAAAVSLGAYRWYQSGLGGSVGFNTIANYAVGTNPAYVATADFNNDGKLDIVSANYTTNNVSVLINTGSGFSAATNYPVGTNPYTVATADFNGDGKPDIVAVNSGDNNVSVLTNTGSGFSAATNYPVGSSPDSVATADFNSDGKPDIVAANSSNNNVSVLLNTGSSFSAATNYPAGGSLQFVTTADLDGDNKPDILTANWSTNTVSVLINTGSGFSAATGYSVGTNPESITTADVDGDGKLDIIAANYTSNNVSVLLNTGSGFSAATNYPVGTGPFSVTAADMDGDGKPDIVAVNRGDNNVSILLNTGSGFSSATNYAVGSYPEAVTTADLNGDGRPDIITADYYDNAVSVLVQLPGIGAPLSDQDNAYDQPDIAPVELRLAVRVDNSGLASSSKNLQLMYALAKGQTCATVATTDYVPVTTSTPIAYYDNSSYDSGTPIIQYSNDPTDGGRVNVYQTYQEANPFTNSQGPIYAGQDGVWQLSIVVNNTTLRNKNFCLRMADNSGNVLSANNVASIGYGPLMSELMHGGNWWSRSGIRQNMVGH